MIDDASRRSLAGVHPDLVRVVVRARELAAFRVTEGLRDKARQARLVAEGKSKTMASRHLTGHAVDLVALVDGRASYVEAHMRALADAMKAAAAELGVPIEWGGDWKSFQDTPHFQLPRSAYPDGDHDAHVVEPVEHAVLDVEAVDVSAAPAARPQVAAAPASPRAAVVAAIYGSRTITGALVALLGALIQYMRDAAQFVLDVAGEVSGLDPVRGLAETAGVNLPSIGFGLTVFGLVLVVGRRLDAAAKGKVG